MKWRRHLYVVLRGRSPHLLSFRAAGSATAAADDDDERRLLLCRSSDGLRAKSPPSPSVLLPTSPFPCASRSRSASKDLARLRHAMASAVRPSFLSSIALCFRTFTCAFLTRERVSGFRTGAGGDKASVRGENSMGPRELLSPLTKRRSDDAGHRSR